MPDNSDIYSSEIRINLGMFEGQGNRLSTVRLSTKVVEMLKTIRQTNPTTRPPNPPTRIPKIMENNGINNKAIPDLMPKYLNLWS